MAGNWARIQGTSGTAALDPSIGNIRDLTLHDEGRTIRPLHAAPWIGDADLPADLPPVERALAGDFFCAPFGASDVEDAPPHGWSANAPWRVVAEGPGTLMAELTRPVMGARLTKALTVGPGPVLYQVHEIEGGAGGLPVAHHPMIRVEGGARLTASPKRAALTGAPLEPGRARLAPHAEGPPEAFPAADGGTVDLGRLPIGDAHEDFVTLIEAEGAALGWTAVVRAADVVFVLKDPAVLPVTMLWHSNGGRDHAPWSGRHRGVLGIEDGCAAGAAGHRAALGANPLSDRGVPTALPLAPGRRHRVAHALGAIARPAGWSAVAEVGIEGDALTLTGDDGTARALPWRAGFLRPGL